jgi:hypothetical protein
MCCDPPAADRLPPVVAAMLVSYRALAAERPADWGDEVDGYDRAQPYGRWLGNRLLAAVFTKPDDWPGTVRACLEDPLPAGLVVATMDAGGIGLRAGPSRTWSRAARPRWPCRSTPVSRSRPRSRSAAPRCGSRPAGSSWSSTP